MAKYDLIGKLKLSNFSRDCGNGPAGDDGHPVRAGDQEGHVQDRVPALQGAALQAHDHPQVQNESKCSEAALCKPSLISDQTD